MVEQRRNNKFATVWIELKGKTQQLWLADIEKDESGMHMWDYIKCYECGGRVNNRTVLRTTSLVEHRNEKLYHLRCAGEIARHWVAGEGQQIPPRILAKFWTWLEEKAVMDAIVNGDQNDREELT